MSHAATNWAIEQRGRISPHALTLLISLADFENGQSGKCCPTRRAIEKDCGMPVRSITRYTKELVECGLVVVEELKREDGSICANQFHLTYRSTRRGQTVDTPSTECPTPDQKELGVVQNVARGSTVSGQQKEQPRKRTPEENISFEQFWDVWPRKRAKGAAEKAWAKLSVDDQRAAIDAPKPGGDPKYIPHPATWLNGKRWLDEPDPPPAAAPKPKHPKAQEREDIFAQLREEMGLSDERGISRSVRRRADGNDRDEPRAGPQVGGPFDHRDTDGPQRGPCEAGLRSSGEELQVAYTGGRQ